MSPFFFVKLAISAYIFIVIAAVVMHWLINLNIISYHNPIARNAYDFVYKLTEPVFQRVRSVLPDLGGIDISPIIVIIGLQLLSGVLPG